MEVATVTWPIWKFAYIWHFVHCHLYMLKLDVSKELIWLRVD